MAITVVPAKRTIMDDILQGFGTGFNIVNTLEEKKHKREFEKKKLAADEAYRKALLGLEEDRLGLARDSASLEERKFAQGTEEFATTSQLSRDTLDANAAYREAILRGNKRSQRGARAYNKVLSREAEGRIGINRLKMEALADGEMASLDRQAKVYANVLSGAKIEELNSRRSVLKKLEAGKPAEHQMYLDYWLGRKSNNEMRDEIALMSAKNQQQTLEFRRAMGLATMENNSLKMGLAQTNEYIGIIYKANQLEEMGIISPEAKKALISGQTKGMVESGKLSGSPTQDIAPTEEKGFLEGKKTGIAAYLLGGPVGYGLLKGYRALTKEESDPAGLR